MQTVTYPFTSKNTHMRMGDFIDQIDLADGMTGACINAVNRVNKVQIPETHQ